MQKKVIFVILLCLLQSACGIIRPYRPDIQQGNVMADEDVAQLKVGMTKAQVRYLLGTPVLEESFDPNRWDYVFTVKPYKGQTVEKRLSVYFGGDKVVEIKGSPTLMPLPNQTLPIPMVGG